MSRKDKKERYPEVTVRICDDPAGLNIIRQEGDVESLYGSAIALRIMAGLMAEQLSTLTGEPTQFIADRKREETLKILTEQMAADPRNKVVIDFKRKEAE